MLGVFFIISISIWWLQSGRVEIQMWWFSVLKETSGVEVIKTVLLGSEGFFEAAARGFWYFTSQPGSLEGWDGLVCGVGGLGVLFQLPVHREQCICGTESGTFKVLLYLFIGSEQAPVHCSGKTLSLIYICCCIWCIRWTCTDSRVIYKELNPVLDQLR